MIRIISSFVCVFCLSLSSSLAAKIIQQNGTIPLSCGTNSFIVEYRVSFEESKKDLTKSAMLLAGSPAYKFFSEESEDHELLAGILHWSGYKVIEVKYPTRFVGVSSRIVAQGFYDACYHQGFDNVGKHAAELYDALTKRVGYEPTNPTHRMVAAGYSLGALQLQLMLSFNKKFDHIALTGVLLGDAVQGCLVGIEHERRLYNNEEICLEPTLTLGLGWGSFMPYVQQITLSGKGCCIEDENSFGNCQGEKNEYTKALNIENHPNFTASNITIFEGKIACDPRDINFSGANPAQAQYIADKRTKAGKKTEVIYYAQCGHDVIGCAKAQAREDMMRVLAPEIFRKL